MNTVFMENHDVGEKESQGTGENIYKSQSPHGRKEGEVFELFFYTR
jgi:hypothetical protein